MIPEIELIKHINRETAVSYAAMVRALEWLIPTTWLPWPVRWWMRYDRWLYGRLLAGLLEEMPVEERAAALGQAPEAKEPG